MDAYLKPLDNLFLILEPHAHCLLTCLTKVTRFVNGSLISFTPLQIILLTTLSVSILLRIKRVLTPNLNDDHWSAIKRLGSRFAKRVPILGPMISKELNKAAESIKEELMSAYQGTGFLRELPKDGLSGDELLKMVDSYESLSKIKWKDGRVSGAIYSQCGDDARNELLAKVYSITAYTNPLHADIFPGIRKMEAEIVRMTLTLFHGSDEACGSVSTGGTESILLACKAYRDYARYVKGIQYPELVVPVTAHAAFDKAAQFLHIKINHVRIDSRSMKVDVNAMRRAINKNTCLLVASAPQFPHGIVDPVEEICELGLRYDIPVHVDSCLGGFLVPFTKEAGFKEVYCDFRIKGVCSISADTHKYGYAPKGSSVIMYSHPKYRHYQFSVQPDWPGGVYASPTISGSRSGSTIATCWAALVHQGKTGYVDATRKILKTTRYLKDELSKIDGLFIFGDPQLSVIAVGSNQFSIFRLSAGLGKRGWSLNTLQFPAGFHICVTLMHTANGVAETFLSDVKELTTEILKEPNMKLEGTAAVYGTAQSIPDRSLISELALSYLDCYYSTEK